MSRKRFDSRLRQANKTVSFLVLYGILLVSPIFATANGELVEGQIRLVAEERDGRGRVTIYYNNTWGTICSNNWDMDDATVVCRQLGYSAAIEAFTKPKDSQNQMPVWLNNVRCDGIETNVTNCASSGWGTNHCNSNQWEDAAVECQVQEPEPRGDTGPNGFPDATGPEGPEGPEGPPGPPGPAGPSGPIGPPGPRGPSGPSGPLGPSGASGPSGPVGPVGPVGPSGAVGPVGPTGPAGPVGPVGPIGPVGHAGPRGHRGAVGPRGMPGENAGSSGSSTYIHWGSSSCPHHAELVYSGIVAGSKHNVGGGGSNYLCLPDNPEYDITRSGENSARAKIYSAEYDFTSFSRYWPAKCNHEATCAVCRVSSRSSMVMIPAKKNCPTGWTKEYYGYLMSEKSDNARHSRDFVCFDVNMGTVPHTGGHDDAAELFLVEANCNPGHIPCSGSYVNGAELSCVVCTK